MNARKPEHETWDEQHGEHGTEARCICGWAKRHPRSKVRNKSAAAHIAKQERASR